MNPNETTRTAGPCANEACARPAEPGETYCADCGLERSLYFRDRRESEADPRVDALRETARRLFAG
jgi:hypothetical protein